MLQYHLTIAVLSGDSALAQLVQNVPAPEGIAVEVIHRSQVDAELVKQ